MNGHFLQSKVWEKYEGLEGYKTYFLDGEGYHALAILKTTPVGWYLFCPYGPAVAKKKYLETALGALRNLAKDKEAMFVRVEPCLKLVNDDGKIVDNSEEITGAELRKMGLKKSHDIDPAHTWVVDLTRSEEEILKGTERDRVRHWKSHNERGVKIWKTQEPEEIARLTSLLQKLGEARAFTPQDEEHLKNQLKAGFATLYIAEYEGKTIAATLVHDYEKTRFVVHAAADDEYRKLRGGTSLALEAMIDFKREGGEKFDFWGITTSEDPKHPWYGFTQYKKSFDGYQVDYCGTWDLPVAKAKYKVYQGLREVNRIKRKI